MFLINNLISRFIYGIAKFFLHFNIWQLKTKYLLILNRHAKLTTRPLNPTTFKMLVLGEDRKYFYHIGIDIWGIVRAFYLNFKGEVQGGSTITQQYIRALTNYNEMSYKRKIIEIFLALLVNHKFDKTVAAQNYMNIAYFGDDMIGMESAIKKIGSRESLVLLDAELIARLKYPQNKYQNDENSININRRKVYLYDLYVGNRELSHKFYWKKRSYFPYKLEAGEQLNYLNI